MTGYLVYVVVFVAVTVLAGAALFLFKDFGGNSTEDRLEVLTGKKKESKESQGIMKDSGLEAADGFSGMLSRSLKGIENLVSFFEQADSPIRPDHFVMVSLGAVGVGVVLAWAVKSPPPLYPVFGIVVGLLPLTWLILRRHRRFGKFAQQLPEAMALIARALRAGHSLNSGIHLVVEEMPVPIATEFMLAYEEQNLGIPIERSLKNMLRRMPNMDLKFFVTAVAVQKQAGGDLAEVLDKISYLIRERFKILGQVKALTAEGRLSGIVLQALPVALFLTVYYLNPDYVMLLFKEELGKQMLMYSMLLQILGAFFIKKIVNIKV